VSSIFRTVAVALAAVALVAFAAAASAARPRFDTRVLAHIPDPGFTALSVLGPDRTIYGGTFFPATGNAGDGIPSKVFAWAPDGRLLHTWTVQGQDLSQDHGVQAAVTDARGRVYLLDKSPARVLVLDPATGEQRTYATIPDLAPCAAGSTTNCSATTTDNPPEPDYAAWAPDGSLYVTDDTQATIFRVPPGGGEGRPWLTDPRFDAIQFGLTGLALTPDRRGLALTTVGSSPTVDPMAATGKLMEVGILPDGSPGPLKTLWASGVLEAPDGFAFAASGNIYVSLLGPAANQVVVLSRQGGEQARFPSAAENAAAPVPYDSPSSVIFDGDRLIVTNDAYFSGDRSHQVLFDVAAGEPGARPFVPAEPVAGAAAAPPSPAGGAPTVEVVVTPRSARVRRPTRLHIRATVRGSDGTAAATVAGARLVAGRIHRALDAGGRATVALTPRRAGLLRIRVTVPGAGSGLATVRIRNAKH
jgi:sugar lactone lactonase YvrE